MKQNGGHESSMWTLSSLWRWRCSYGDFTRDNHLHVLKNRGVPITMIIVAFLDLEEIRH